MNQIRERLKALRMEMLRHNLDAYYISGTDPHMSEYLADRWQTRAFITGFTGSYGIVVVTNEEAGLWTDSRYFIQAETQLRGTGIKMFKLRVPGAVLPEKWLAEKLDAGSKTGVDPSTLSVQSFRNLKKEMESANIQLIETTDLLDKIWDDRPGIPEHEIFELKKKYSGYSRKEKISLLLDAIKNEGADIHIVTALDDLAWIFNLRGTDIAFNPVFFGFGALGKTGAFLFADKKKIPVKIHSSLEKDQIRIMDYDAFYPWLKSLRNKTVYIDPSSANNAVIESIDKGNKIREGRSKIAELKAVKNQTELKMLKDAAAKDGAALVEFLFWLKNNAGLNEVTEYLAGFKLEEVRAKQRDFRGQSFYPVVGYQSNGAIVHYSASEENALTIKKEGILLFDSGGHYLQGTTDITRTVALGEPSEKQKEDFTLVLKGMIALTNAKFPEGTKGCNLDVLARKALWDKGLNYGHGTGHGVGFFLNVHEGPMSIRQECNDVALKPGMVVSNEPGIYREGEYGIRIENMIVCVEKEETGFGNFLGFETITLFPIDSSLIKSELLTNHEKEWMNSYHSQVAQSLMPLLSEELQVFLNELVAVRF